MEFNKYQRAAMRTNDSKNESEMFLNAILGLNGETGEISDLVKKYYFQGHEWDEKKVVDELGDVLWYCALLAESLGYDLNEVARLNIKKLKNRYPNGFEKEKSIERTK